MTAPDKVLECKECSIDCNTFMKLELEERLNRICVWLITQLCNYKKGCTRLTAASDKVYQLVAHGLRLLPPLKMVAMK